MFSRNRLDTRQSRRNFGFEDEARNQRIGRFAWSMVQCGPVIDLEQDASVVLLRADAADPKNAMSVIIRQDDVAGAVGSMGWVRRRRPSSSFKRLSSFVVASALVKIVAAGTAAIDTRADSALCARGRERRESCVPSAAMPNIAR